MRNSLTRNENHYSDVPVHNSNNGDIKNFMNHFWHMLDFPRYGEPADPEPKLEISENKNRLPYLPNCRELPKTTLTFRYLPTAI